MTNFQVTESLVTDFQVTESLATLAGVRTVSPSGQANYRRLWPAQMIHSGLELLLEYFCIPLL